MKNLLLALFLIIFGVNMSAQKEDIGVWLDRYKDKEGVTSIKIAKPMFGILDQLGSGEELWKNFTPVFDKIEGLRILIMNKKQWSDFFSSQSEVDSFFEKTGYDELFTVDNEDAKIKVFSSDVSDGVLTNPFLDIHSDREKILLFFEGKVSVEDIREMSESLKKKSDLQMKAHSTVEQLRKVGDFHGVNVSQGVELSFTQEKEAQVKVIADSDKIERVKTEVKDGVLHVFIQKQGYRGVRFKKLKVQVSAPQLTSIKVSSGANFQATNLITTPTLDITASSAADIAAHLHVKDRLSISSSSGADVELNVKANQIYTNASSGSDIELKGSVKKAYYTLSSGASVDAEDLLSDMVELNASSAATAKIHAIKTLDATASSSATVRYKSNKDLQKSNINTSSGGSVRPFVD